MHVLIVQLLIVYVFVDTLTGFGHCKLHLPGQKSTSL